MTILSPPKFESKVKKLGWSLVQHQGKTLQNHFFKAQTKSQKYRVILRHTREFLDRGFHPPKKPENNKNATTSTRPLSWLSPKKGSSQGIPTGSVVIVAEDDDFETIVLDFLFLEKHLLPLIQATIIDITEDCCKIHLDQLEAELRNVQKIRQQEMAKKTKEQLHGEYLSSSAETLSFFNPRGSTTSHALYNFKNAEQASTVKSRAASDVAKHIPAATLLDSLPTTQQSVTSQTNAPAVRVLSLDGGKLKGFVLLRMLEEIETQTQKPLHELFDVICGTSLGAIFAFMIAINARSSAHIGAFYKKLRQDLEQASMTHPSMKLDREDLCTKVLETALKEEFGEMDMSQACLTNSSKAIHCFAVTCQDFKPTIITNYSNPTSSNPMYKIRTSTIEQPIKVYEALRASTAAPRFYNPCILHGRSYRDGGLVANNSCEIAILETLRIHSAEVIPSLIVVSLGTGKYLSPNTDEEQRTRDILRQKEQKKFEKHWATTRHSQHTEEGGAISIRRQNSSPKPLEYYFKAPECEDETVLQEDPSFADQEKHIMVQQSNIVLKSERIHQRILRMIQQEAVGSFVHYFRFSPFNLYYNIEGVDGKEMESRFGTLTADYLQEDAQTRTRLQQMCKKLLEVSATKPSETKSGQEETASSFSPQQMHERFIKHLRERKMSRLQPQKQVVIDSSDEETDKAYIEQHTEEDANQDSSDRYSDCNSEQEEEGGEFVESSELSGKAEAKHRSGKQGERKLPSFQTFAYVEEVDFDDDAEEL